MRSPWLACFSGGAFGGTTSNTLPLEGIQIEVQSPRDRVLTDDELAKVWHAAEGSGWPFGRIIQLCILLGQRRSETAAIQRSWIDTKQMMITFPREVMKGNRPHIIPYGKMTAARSETIPEMGDYLFPGRGNEGPFNGWSKSTDALRGKLDGVAHFTPHDLRRTFASNLQKLGIRLEVTEALLGHVSGSTGGIVGVYQRHEYGPEKGHAIQKWEKASCRAYAVVTRIMVNHFNTSSFSDSQSPFTISPAQLVPGEHRDAPFSKGVSDDTETGYEEGTENRLWRAVQLRAHRASRSGRPIPQTGKAWRLQSGVVCRGSAELDRRARCFSQHASSPS